MVRPVDCVKSNDTANSRALGDKQDFELDSRFDFIYSEFFKQFRVSGQYNAKQILMGNTII
jgi:hypothetical protein